MLKGLTTWIFILTIVSGLYAQPRTVLSANNISAPISANGSLFSGGLQVPKGSGINSIANTQIWIGGKNNSNIHIAGRLHDSLPNKDFWAGPLNTTTLAAADSALWDKIYKVTAAEIATHQKDYNKQGYTMPDGIKYWPGSSPQGQGYAQVLAPFVDFNNNKVYEPALGEYPYIKGDEACYFIINDNANTHFATGGLPMGVEVHGMAYQFTNPAVENTVFLQLSFINRSANNYDSVYAGLWTDFTLGNANDNYLSTNISKNALLVYNGDTLDDNGYGANPPAQAVVFLNRPLDYTIEIAADNSQRGIPQNPQEFYNYLKRTWRGGSQLTRGVNGYQSGLPTNHIYDGDPCNETNPGWTEIGSALMQGKRTAVASFGPVSLAAQGYLKLDVAFVWARSNAGYLKSVCSLNQAVDDVLGFYKKEISSTNQLRAIQFTAYPNPASQVITIQLGDGANATAEILNLQGQSIGQYSIENGNANIPVTHLAQGVYFVRVSTAQGVSVQKVSVIH